MFGLGPMGGGCYPRERPTPKYGRKCPVCGRRVNKGDDVMVTQRHDGSVETCHAECSVGQIVRTLSEGRDGQRKEPGDE